ncbi:hypothetical protein EDC04DRAFT_2890458 [Pisolithus marmoratus]|nr:hypothetical protein EDC04DRAFT_2890458 [Pisolithus marmoratus]
MCEACVHLPDSTSDLIGVKPTWSGDLVVIDLQSLHMNPINQPTGVKRVCSSSNTTTKKNADFHPNDSGVSSKSNSSPHTVHTIKHHYVPPSPTRKRHGHSHSVESISGTGESEGRYPSPLPIPPTFGSAGSTTLSTIRHADEFTTPQRKRADTLPSGSTNSCTSDATLTDSSLPSEPKQWTTDQLITYLSTSLYSSSDPDASNTDGVFDWVQECGLTGREWLRLTDRHLAGTSLSDTQISLVLNNSRTLRADSLRSLICVDSNSISSVELSTSSSNTAEDTENPISPPLTSHRSNSVSESFMRRYRDLAHIRVRRRGKVKGLVETWEREVNRQECSSSTEGSVCSEGSVFGSDAGSESEIGEENVVGQEVENAQEHFETSHQGPSSINGSVSPTPLTADTTFIASNPPPPHTSINALDEEEPSIEDLLASSDSLEGVRAWEADLRLGETVKRIPTAGLAHSAIVVLDNPQSSFLTSGEEGADSARAYSVGRNNVRGQNERTVATIYPEDEIPQNTDAVSTIDVGVRACDTFSLAGRLPSEWTEQTTAIRAVEASLASTRAELEILKARLEILEADLAHSEAISLKPCEQPNSNLHQDERQPRKKDAQVSTDDRQLLQPTQDETIRHPELRWTDIVRSVSTGIMTWLYPHSQPITHRNPVNRSGRRKDSLSPLFYVELDLLVGFADLDYGPGRF